MTFLLGILNAYIAIAVAYTPASIVVVGHHPLLLGVVNFLLDIPYKLLENRPLAGESPVWQSSARRRCGSPQGPWRLIQYMGITGSSLETVIVSMRETGNLKGYTGYGVLLARKIHKSREKNHQVPWYASM